MKKNLLFVLVIITLFTIIPSCKSEYEKAYGAKGKIIKYMARGREDKAIILVDRYISYQFFVENNFLVIMQLKGVDYMLDRLAAWEFDSKFHENAEGKLGDINYWSRTNSEWNSEATEFNDYLDIILKQAILSNDLETSLRCLNMYVPMAVESERKKLGIHEGLFKDDEIWGIKFVLDNTYKQAAEDKIKFLSSIKNYEAKFNAAQFAQGSSELSVSAKTVLNELATFLSKNSSMMICIEGHTSAEGDVTTNQKLSEERAFAAMYYLIDKNVDPARLSAKGYGSSHLKDPENPNSQVNRRTEFVIVK